MSHNRREFLKRAAAASAVAGAATTSYGWPWSKSKKSPAIWKPSVNEKLRVGQIGCGGRGKAHFKVWKGERFVAACDIDRKTLGMFSERALPDLKKYTDYRELIAKEGADLDAIIVATPDHNHFAAAMLALKAGIPVYCEKPVAWSVQECLDLAAEAQARQIPTQMGNQGNAKTGWRQIYSIVHSGVIGDVESVKTWTNRPIWPQGLPKSNKEDPIPEQIDWDSWIGVAPMRQFRNGVYHSFKWRGFRDFGCGALGDMACHTTNAMFQVMKPNYDLTAEILKVENATEDQFPSKEIIRWTFEKSGECPGFEAYWYDGGLKPEKPKAMGEAQLPKTCSMFVGTKGILISKSDYNDNPVVYKDGKVVKPKVEQMIKPSIGLYEEWTEAIKGRIPWDSSMSRFAYAGKMTAIINTGIVAETINKKISFSAKTMKFNDAEANKRMSRVPREGWEEAYQV